MLARSVDLVSASPIVGDRWKGGSYVRTVSCSAAWSAWRGAGKRAASWLPYLAEAARSVVGRAGKWETCFPSQPPASGPWPAHETASRFPSPRGLSTEGAVLPIGGARQQQDSVSPIKQGVLSSLSYCLIENQKHTPWSVAVFISAPALVGVSFAGIARQQDRPAAVAVNACAAVA